MPDIDGFTLLELARARHDLGVTRASGWQIAKHPIKPIRQAQRRQAVAGAPAAPDARTASPGAADLATAAGMDCLRVLVAEDNAVNQKLAWAMLTRLGHTSVLVSDGREAIAEWGTGSYDVIFTDVQMPDSDGLDATRDIPAGSKPHLHPCAGLWR